MKAIVSQIILSSFTSKVDGSLGFRGTTPELSTAEKVAMMELQGRNVRALFEPMDFATDGKVEIKNPLGGKTPGERLRGVMYVAWKQFTAKKMISQTFDEFYVKHMERAIEDWKQQLDPE